jgi:hypothetical protein
MDPFYSPGTHYFQSNRVEKLTPRSARRKKDEAKRKKHGEVNGVKHLPESSTEDEILNADSTTVSYDERWYCLSFFVSGISGLDY